MGDGEDVVYTSTGVLLTFEVLQHPHFLLSRRGCFSSNLLLHQKIHIIPQKAFLRQNMGSPSAGNSSAACSVRKRRGVVCIFFWKIL